MSLEDAIALVVAIALAVLWTAYLISLLRK